MIFSRSASGKTMNTKIITLKGFNNNSPGFQPGVRMDEKKMRFGSTLNQGSKYYVSAT
jgi:hypothetical protein